MALTGGTIAADAARELAIIGEADTLNTSDAAVLLSQLSMIVDDWNSERDAIFATEFLAFTFVPNLNPHTIGPAGATWTVATQRPVFIESAAVVLSSGANQVNAPLIRMHDTKAGIPQWYMDLSTPNITTAYPTDGYYDPTWPNGSLYLWPVPSTAYECQIQVRQVLTDYTMNTTFTMPPGYRSAMTLTLAENSATAFSRPMPADLPRKALLARARIFANNTGANRISTYEAGMARRGGRRRSNFNYLTGMTQ